MRVRPAVRRWIAVWLLALLVALGVKFHDATSPAANVYACSYSVEHTNTATTQFWSPYFQAYDVLHAEIVTYAGNLGSGYQCPEYKEYNSLQWTTLGTPGSYSTAVRVWDCGVYEGSWVAPSSSVWSPAFKYPGCNRQADNSGSLFHISANGQNVSVYVNQG